MVWPRSYRKMQSWYLNRGLLILCHYVEWGTQVVMVSEDGISSSPAAARRQNPRHIDSFNKCLLNTCNVPGTKLGTWDPKVKKTDVVHAVTELIFWWKRQTPNCAGKLPYPHQPSSNVHQKEPWLGGWRQVPVLMLLLMLCVMSIEVFHL